MLASKSYSYTMQPQMSSNCYMIVSHWTWLENNENYLSVFRNGDIIGKFSIILIIFLIETPSGIGSSDSGILLLWSVCYFYLINRIDIQKMQFII